MKPIALIFGGLVAFALLTRNTGAAASLAAQGVVTELVVAAMS